MNQATYLASYIFFKVINVQELISLGSNITFVPNNSNKDAKMIREKCLLRLSYNFRDYYSEVEYKRIIDIADQVALDKARVFRNPNPCVFHYLFDCLESVLDIEGIIKPTSIQTYKNLQSAFGSDLLNAIYAVLNKSKIERLNEQYFIPRQKDNDYTPNLTENHAHLFATGPIFSIIWNSHMCNPRRTENVSLHSKISERRLHQYNMFKDDIINIPLKYQLQLAAIIRHYLLKTIENKSNIHDYHKIFNLVNKFNSINYKINTIYVETIFDEARQNFDDFSVSSNLNPSKIQIKTKDLEDTFLENAISHIFENKLNNYQIYLFHLYLVIKLTFRSELIQENSKIGFTNFQQYQSRKNPFLTSSTIDNYLARTFQMYKNCFHFESRISPSKTLSSDILSFNKIALVKKQTDKFNTSEYNPKTSIVIHFLKEADKSFMKNQPRNLSLRNNCNKQAEYLIQYLKTNPEQQVVVGIDAASSETDCRPEVFAPVFRRLSSYELGKKSRSQLFKTFHVGEEFSDIPDGLRAIYEAIIFLELDKLHSSGKSHRIGHCLAAGVDIPYWYKCKNQTIFKRLHDHLDDLAFMIFVAKDVIKLHQYEWILDEFKRIYNQVYSFTIANQPFDIWEIYWKAFHLRSDCPEALFNPRSPSFNYSGGLWNNYHLSTSASSIEARNLPKCKELYRQYHYDQLVRTKGSKIITFSPTHEYIEIVQTCQNFMIDFITNKNIAIEANPTSNVKIAVIDGYVNHPIFNWYEKNNNINISINTDDAGIFDTDLLLEHLLIHNAAIERGYSPNQANELIQKLIDNGKRQVFVL